jgi:hypothetical protein
MGRKFEDKMDIVDTLENIRSQITFMSEACSLICGEECAMGDSIVHGMSLVFDNIENQVADVSKEIQDNVCEIDTKFNEITWLSPVRKRTGAAAKNLAHINEQFPKREAICS